MPMLIVESKDRQCIVDFVKALVWKPDVLGLTLPGFTLSVSVWFVGYYITPYGFSFHYLYKLT